MNVSALLASVTLSLVFSMDPTFSLPARTTPTTKSYDRPAAQVEALVRAVRTLPLGTSLDDAERALGKPDEDKRASDKKTNRFIGRFVYYYIHLVNKSARGDGDGYIRLRFDASNRMIEKIRVLVENDGHPIHL